MASIHALSFGLWLSLFLKLQLFYIRARAPETTACVVVFFSVDIWAIVFFRSFTLRLCDHIVCEMWAWLMCFCLYVVCSNKSGMSCNPRARSCLISFNFLMFFVSTSSLLCFAQFLHSIFSCLSIIAQTNCCCALREVCVYVRLLFKQNHWHDPFVFTRKPSENRESEKSWYA